MAATANASSRDPARRRFTAFNATGKTRVNFNFGRRNFQRDSGSKVLGGGRMAEGLSVKPVRAITWTDVGGREGSLIQRCAARDEDACAELVTEHQRMVYQLSLNLLNDHNEALDLSQEVFLRVFRTIHSFRGQSALRTWIYRIVVNQARNRQRWWRRRHKSQQVSLDEHLRQSGDLESTTTALPDRQ